MATLEQLRLPQFEIDTVSDGSVGSAHSVSGRRVSKSKSEKEVQAPSGATLSEPPKTMKSVDTDSESEDESDEEGKLSTTESGAEAKAEGEAKKEGEESPTDSDQPTEDKTTTDEEIAPPPVEEEEAPATSHSKEEVSESPAPPFRPNTQKNGTCGLNRS